MFVSECVAVQTAIFAKVELRLIFMSKPMWLSSRQHVILHTTEIS
jgi:hypothetical protein